MEKNALEKWWIGIFPPNLAFICLMVSRKLVFQKNDRPDVEDAWKATDGCVQTVVLLCSSTKQN